MVAATASGPGQRAAGPPLVADPSVAGESGEWSGYVSTFIRGPQVLPVLGRVVVERQQLVEVVGDLRDGLAELRPVGGLELVTASRAWRRSSAFQISARAFFAPGCADFGRAASTFAILWALCRHRHKFH
jgi:hypothetical protein